MPVEEPQDDIDRMVEFWKEENPQLDSTTKAVAMRLRRASQHLEGRFVPTSPDSGVDEYWEIEVLLTLRRAPDHRASAGDLGRECQVTSGAITNRISRLEKRGWVRRDVDPDDRRQVLVSLTPTGLAQADHIIAMKTQAERWAFDGVDRKLLERISRDLRTLLFAFDTQSHEVDGATVASSDSSITPRRERRQPGVLDTVEPCSIYPDRRRDGRPGGYRRLLLLPPITLGHG